MAACPCLVSITGWRCLEALSAALLQAHTALAVLSVAASKDFHRSASINDMDSWEWAGINELRGNVCLSVHVPLLNDESTSLTLESLLLSVPSSSYETVPQLISHTCSNTVVKLPETLRWSGSRWLCGPDTRKLFELSLVVFC